MKRLFLLSIISLALTSNAKLVTPKPLHMGDTVAIISPASCIKPAKVDSAVNVLRSWGLVPVVGKYALTANGSYAGTVSQRLSDLRWAFENPNIKAIICTRGGYGSYEVLDLLPKGYFRRYPKWFIGYSDITAI
ncbi:MAG: LD-carboxypeptidase, partial [Muribaculaceae bacterium]|nr:LD-carboxypeptidase [Muribaculaceae bacterium]